MSNRQSSFIGFTFFKIITEQFAILEEAVNMNEQLGLSTQLRFGINKTNKVLAIYCRFRFSTKENPFLILETSSQFKIEDESWKRLVGKNEKNIEFPRNFVVHLSMLSVGAARGILHAKTENTIFNHIVLPTINVDQLIRSDILLDLREEAII